MTHAGYLVLLLLLLAGCAPAPESIRYGHDQCEYCKMTITDPKFGGEVVTKKGKVFKFDAIECIFPILRDTPNIQAALILVTPFDRPRTLVSIDSVTFVTSKEIRSPMGANLAAFAGFPSPEIMNDSTAQEYNDWGELIKMINY